MAKENNILAIGREAIELAEQNENITLFKHTDPTEEAGKITVEKAYEVAAEDPALVYAVDLKAIAEAAANEYYLANTKKSYEELKDQLSYASNWFPNAFGDEWETELEAIACGEEMAQQALDEEAE